MLGEIGLNAPYRNAAFFSGEVEPSIRYRKASRHVGSIALQAGPRGCSLLHGVQIFLGSRGALTMPGA